MNKIIYGVAASLFFLYMLLAPQATQQKKRPPQQPVPAAATAAPGEIVLQSNYTNSTTTPTDTPFSFSVGGSTTWTMSCALYFSGTSKVMQIDLTGPNATPKTLGYSFDNALSGPVGGSQNNIASSWGTSLGLPNNVPTPNQRLSSIVSMGVTTGPQAGNITVQASAPAGTITIYQGSWCRIQ